MKRSHLRFIFFFLLTNSFSQYPFEPSAENPFGLPNPEAPPQLFDFAPLIGECNCKSTVRNPDQSWGESTDMIWRFKYIMNGMAVQDETLKADGRHSGSIRQYIMDSTRWYVHYYSSGTPTTILPVWEGNKTEKDKIVLYREQIAPNGMTGSYRLTFSDIDSKGFNWIGEWVSTDGSFVFPTWKIECTRRKSGWPENEKEKILAAAQKFSDAYIRGDYETMADAYSEDGKIFPNNTKIIEGREGIKKRWELSDGAKTLHHEMKPLEITFLGKYAYGYGYYEGKSRNMNGSISGWKGKYVIVWKKEDENWKMYLDIWNRVAD